MRKSCISFDSYIKPQLSEMNGCATCGCISFDSYIKPQLIQDTTFIDHVVYLLIPTSNHNCAVLVNDHCVLYIFWFLHQTTTAASNTTAIISCISFDSYIKPQPGSVSAMHVKVVYLLIPTSNHNPLALLSLRRSVVYLLIPTSNHNILQINRTTLQLYIFWFLHQTTTRACWETGSYQLYIFWFLHQTTTKDVYGIYRVSCISFDSYIKPQPIEYNILIHNIYQSLLLIRNGVQDIISITKVLKKLQLNRFADNFFRYFTLINTYGLTPEVIDISILLICYDDSAVSVPSVAV